MQTENAMANAKNLLRTVVNEEVKEKMLAISKRYKFEGINMTEERLKAIKRIFTRYRQNATQLKQLERPGLKAVAYDKVAVVTDKSSNSVEQLMITYLIDREKLEKEIALVDRIYEYYADDRDVELAELIDARFRNGNLHWKAANSCYISDRQGLRWLDKAYHKAEEFAAKMGIL